jgi:hypothetical protein
MGTDGSKKGTPPNRSILGRFQVKNPNFFLPAMKGQRLQISPSQPVATFVEISKGAHGYIHFI